MAGLIPSVRDVLLDDIVSIVSIDAVMRSILAYTNKYTSPLKKD